MKYLQSLKIKQLISFVICLFLCSCQNDEVLEQRPINGTEPIDQNESLNISSDQKSLLDISEEYVKGGKVEGTYAEIEDLLMRSVSSWRSEGYTVMNYSDFKNSTHISSEIKSKYQESLLRYANKNYNQEAYSFVISKQGSTLLQVLEDCPSDIIPNKYTPVSVH